MARLISAVCFPPRPRAAFSKRQRNIAREPRSYSTGRKRPRLCWNTIRELQQILQHAPAAVDYTLAITEYENKDFSILDVISPSCSKGATLKEWTRRRGIAREDVMAVGDNWNDHDMLEFAGLPVVMGNCVPELKSRGWPVTLTNDEGGLAAAIRTYAFKE